MNKTKAEEFRMVWEDDIPVYTGHIFNLEWKDIPWRKLEKRVFKLQKRIYQASSRGDVKATRKLQKTLLRSWAAKCIAVRRVTQDNQGKKTAGVDGVKSLSPTQRINLVKSLKLPEKAKPTRRVWIPKPGSEEKRPLGIPTIRNRALQALVKQALEPEWEARFEPNSYGFRPGRSSQDAIDAIYTAINQKPKFVLDADIAKCFDRINHESLLNKLNTFPTLRKQVKYWLKSGVMDNKELFPTSEGTPQGGVISPLLANIALHGMEERIKQYAETLNLRDSRGCTLGKRDKRSQLNLIRYADDFVIMHEDLAVVQRCQQIISHWLNGIGLELKPSKTQITHTLNNHEGKVGFDFLGFNLRQVKVGDYRAAKHDGRILGFNTLITPSKEKVKLHLSEIRRIIDINRNAPQKALIGALNPVIKGWANYYSMVISSETFHKLGFRVYQKLRSWALYRCNRRSHKKVARKYWQTNETTRWLFATPEGEVLARHSDTQIKRHIKVQAKRSPYDGDWVYWSTRMGKHPEVDARTATLLKRQEGKCNHCGLTFKYGDMLETDHITPKQNGGNNRYNNLQLLHRHCHDTKTANDEAVRHKELREDYLESNPI
jgi:RNA-directed DNA polymerase